MRRASWCAGVAVLVAGLTYACLPDLRTFPLEGTSDGGAVIGSSARCGDGIIQNSDARSEECDEGEGGTSPGCQACRLECAAPGAYLDVPSGHCYFSAGTSTSYTSAQAACEARGAHIMTFGAEDEVERVTAALRPGLDAGDGLFWVGLLVNTVVGGYQAANPEEPGWPYPPLLMSTDCPGCYAPLRPEAGAFPSFATDGGTLELCVLARLTAPFSGYFTTPCVRTGALAVLCEREPPGTRTDECVGGLCIQVPETLGKKRYLYVDTASPAEGAAQSCRSLGGALATFRTPREHEQVVRELSRHLLSLTLKKDTFWIGVSKPPGVDVEWRFDSGEQLPVTWSIWGDGAPERGAGPGRAYVQIGLALYDTSLAHADLAGGARGYVCEFAL